MGESRVKHSAVRAILLDIALADEPYITKREIVTLAIHHARHREKDVVREVWRRLLESGRYDNDDGVRLVRNSMAAINRREVPDHIPTISGRKE